MSNFTKELTGAERDAYIAEHFNKQQKEIKPMKQINTSAFFYVDGIPTKGDWINLESVTDWDDIRQELAKDLNMNADDIDEILCADIEGIARHFYYSAGDCFDLKAWLEFREEMENSHLDTATIDAYLENCGTNGVSVSDIEDAYCGEFEDWTDFAYEMAESCGYLDQMPESVKSYFDYEKFGRDLSYDFFESNGYFFRNC